MTGLRRYIAVRILLLLFVIFCIMTIMFGLIKFMPGDPTTVFFDSNYSQEMIERQKKQWGLTDPLVVQYLHYLKNMATFDFGNSFFQIQPVRQIVLSKLLNTTVMMVPALILSCVLGTFLGAAAPVANKGKKNEPVEEPLLVPTINWGKEKDDE